MEAVAQNLGSGSGTVLDWKLTVTPSTAQGR